MAACRGLFFPGRLPFVEKIVLKWSAIGRHARMDSATCVYSGVTYYVRYTRMALVTVVSCGSWYRTRFADISIHEHAQSM